MNRYVETFDVFDDWMPDASAHLKTRRIVVKIFKELKPQFRDSMISFVEETDLDFGMLDDSKTFMELEKKSRDIVYRWIKENLPIEYTQYQEIDLDQSQGRLFIEPTGDEQIRLMHDKTNIMVEVFGTPD